MSVLFVSNPSSGSADGDVLARVRDVLSGLARVRDFVASSADAFADELRTAAGTSDVVVVAGGDGTFSRAVNALSEARSDVVFGLVPMGTGNDLARTLELGDDPVQVATRLVGSDVKELDLGCITAADGRRFFVNACVGGFSVDVDDALEEETKRRMGRFAFWLGGLKAAADITRYRVRIDGREVNDAVVVGVGNGRTVGGGLELWPDASPDDGLLEACVISAPDLKGGIRAAVRVKAGTHEGTEGVTMFRGARIEVSSNPPMELNVDGEVVGFHTPVTFDVEGVFRMLVPASPGP